VYACNYPSSYDGFRVCPHSSSPVGLSGVEHGRAAGGGGRDLALQLRDLMSNTAGQSISQSHHNHQTNKIITYMHSLIEEDSLVAGFSIHLAFSQPKIKTVTLELFRTSTFYSAGLKVGWYIPLR